VDAAGRDYYPPGDLRVSDADRDRALSELGQALQVGRITADEFDQRSGTITPGALAVLLVVLLIFVRVTRAARS
jgi:hypothetical protein